MSKNYWLTVLALWVVVLGATVIYLGRRLEVAECPYRAKYANLSDINLIFAFDDEYLLYMKWLNAGGDDPSEMWKFYLRMNSYLEELKHRKVGDIAVSPGMRKRAENYLLTNTGSFDYYH